jgi:ABC-type uncharacterized transport system substrate-binding protein
MSTAHVIEHFYRTRGEGAALPVERLISGSALNLRELLQRRCPSVAVLLRGAVATLRHFALFSRCRLNRYALSACAAAFIILQSAASVSAHPHVWVTIHSDVLYGEDGAMIGIRHVWTFDDMYSAFELQGIPHVEKDQYTRQELSSLAHLNVTSMKDYDFFTFVRADGKKVQFADPADYWLDYKNSILTLHFTLPLKSPVIAKKMQIEVYDPTIYVDFEFAKDKPATLIGAPPRCQLVVGFPRDPTPGDQVRLSQLDANPLDPSDTYGEIFANKISVNCQ